MSSQLHTLLYLFQVMHGITNLINGRMIIVRINDRGPYNIISGKNIALSRAVADRLNLMLTACIKIHPILISPADTLTGPGTIGVNIAKLWLNYLKMITVI